MLNPEEPRPEYDVEDFDLSDDDCGEIFSDSDKENCSLDEIDVDDDDDDLREPPRKKRKSDRRIYLIKWKGWSHEYNSWEPRSNLSCKKILKDFHRLLREHGRKGAQRLKHEHFDRDEATKRLELEEFLAKVLQSQLVTPEMLLSAYEPEMDNSRLSSLRQRRTLRARRRCTDYIVRKSSKEFKLRKIDQAQSLIEWEKLLNSVYRNEPRITIENIVDLEGKPDYFQYITESKAMPGIEVPDDPLVGCECTECKPNKDGRCCPDHAGTNFAYFATKKVTYLDVNLHVPKFLARSEFENILNLVMGIFYA